MKETELYQPNFDLRSMIKPSIFNTAFDECDGKNNDEICKKFIEKSKLFDIKAPSQIPFRNSFKLL